MMKMPIILLAVFWGLTASVVHADTEIHHTRVGITKERTRLVWDATAPLQHRLTRISRQEWRLELLKSHFAVDVTRLPLFNTPITLFQGSKKKQESTIRIILKQELLVKSFTLKPQGSYGHRLVLDFYPILHKPSKNPLIIAIDAGHGGIDPGAIGSRGTKEKTVTLAIARQLKNILQQEPGLQPVMVRNGDYFLSLRQRIAGARRAKADIFVSIHADSGFNRAATGSSVYVLSERGASSEAARWLADRENQSDLIGGIEQVNLKNRDAQLASVLLDLSMVKKIDKSFKVAEGVLEKLSTVNRLHRSIVEQAGFVVLKAPDIPSILVETAFLSNRTEEKKLNNKQYQYRIAQAIAAGLKQYATLNFSDTWFTQNVPQGEQSLNL